MSLISCLPRLERVELVLPEPLVPRDLDCLLVALAWLPHLSALGLSVDDYEFSSNSSDTELPWPCPDTSAFAKLRSLTRLALFFGKEAFYTVAGMVDALVSLTGLTQLNLHLPHSAVVPATVRQLKGLRSLSFSKLSPCVLEAGCLELPNLETLEFAKCNFAGAGVLPGVTALQSLTIIVFANGKGPPFFDHQLVQLRRLQRIICYLCGVRGGGACLYLSKLPADMGALRSSLLYLRCNGTQLPQFPLALTQLVALEHLDASENEFAVVPAVITALSRLTGLVLGRCVKGADMLQKGEMHPLDVRALGDMSAFPALCKLQFSFCEVMLCKSMPSAARHASLTSIAFVASHPAPDCALMVLQLIRVLRQLGRGGVVSIKSCGTKDRHGHAEHTSQVAHALPPFNKFLVAVQACGL